jgi:hypothetical protein
MSNDQFNFEISLSVLNHLGRNLYRNFSTVLGEAISNAWDADAKNVWIYVDRANASLTIKDDGVGMTSDDFQGKFLKIGYTKRKEGGSSSPGGRPFIGRKGIGKLALLSCADKIAIITKTEGSEYVGGLIDNSGLDKAITDDLTPKEYPLEAINPDLFSEYTNDHAKGTIIHFENIKDGIRNTLDNLSKTVALYFRFALLDKEFNIYINNELVTVDNLRDLIAKTQYLWEINTINDPLLDRIKKSFGSKNELRQITIDCDVSGFIASVEKPRDLTISGMSDQVSVDLFVNGRLRERALLKHIPTARIAESYLYGQIHFNSLDDQEDRFTTSRESVVADDPKLTGLLKALREGVMPVVIKDWDTWRRKHKQDGDPENTDISRKDRKSEELFNAVSEEYAPSATDDATKHLVDEWVDSMGEDASFSFGSYAECYVGENLIRKYIEHKSLAMTPRATQEVTDRRTTETAVKQQAGISIDIRKNDEDLNYLDMAYLSNIVENSSTADSLPVKAKQYKPLRDALMHTSILSDEAKRKLTTVFDDVKARIKSLF